MARQTLITKEIMKKCPGPMAQDGLYGEAIAYAKFFCPTTGWNWYMTEYDPGQNTGFGFVEGEFPELGYFSIDEFEKINDSFFNNPAPKLGDSWIERDTSFEPTKLSKIDPKRFEDKKFAFNLEVYKEYIKNYLEDLDGLDPYQRRDLDQRLNENPFKLFNDICENNGIRLGLSVDYQTAECFVSFEEFMNNEYEEYAKIVFDKAKNGEIGDKEKVKAIIQLMDMKQTTPEHSNEITILQLKNIEEISWKKAFRGFNELEKLNLEFNLQDYEKVYSTSLDKLNIKPGESMLNDLYATFQRGDFDDVRACPQDFCGHSLSVSDIVLIKNNENTRAYFVDNFGFKNIDDKLNELNHVYDARELYQNFKEWYGKEFPTDEIVNNLNPNIRLIDCQRALERGNEDIYKVIGAGDSVVRERLFDKLSEVIGCDYDVIYDQWLEQKPNNFFDGTKLPIIEHKKATYTYDIGNTAQKVSQPQNVKDKQMENKEER